MEVHPSGMTVVYSNKQDVVKAVPGASLLYLNRSSCSQLPSQVGKKFFL